MDQTTRPAQARPFGRELPLGTEPRHVRQRLEALEHLLERALPIPGTNKRVGLDVLLDFVPGIGPTIGAGLGAYLAWEGRNLGMSKWQIARMGKNIGIDWLPDPVRRRDPRLFLQVEHAQPQDHQETSRQALPRRADDRRPGGKLMVPLHKFVRRR
jgi:hypothetical protein